MSLRATTDHTDFYGRVHLFEIYDEDWGGGVTAHKNTGEGFGDFSHQKIDPRKPWENPIQKGALELSLWLEDASQQQLLTDIKEGDEQQFYIIHYIDGEQEWQGYIYNDLTTYEENILPFRVTLMAKDFTDLGGKDYLVSLSLPDSREQVIETIAYLLNTVGFDIPIRTHTNWIEEHITASEDYLRQIYHETKALREFGRTGDEEDQPITIEEALLQLLTSHRLLLKQTNGAYYLDQLTALEDPENVLESEYDLTGSLQSESTGNDLTVDADSELSVVIQYDNRDNSGLPGLKRSKVKFDHRTQVTNIQFPSVFEAVDDFQQFFVSDGDQTIVLSGNCRARLDDDNDSAEGQIIIQAGGYWWDDEEDEWVGSSVINSFNLSVTHIGIDYKDFSGSFGFTTAPAPADADGLITITFNNALGDFSGSSETEYSNCSFTIRNPIADQNSTYINYQLTQTTANFSVVSESEDSWFGDGPIQYSPGALRYDTGDVDNTSDSWQFRGSTSYRNFHENHLKETMDIQRGWRRLLSALLKGVYKPHQVLSYDSTFFYYLGGSQDVYTGNWTVEIFNLDVETGSDNFEDIPKFADESVQGSGSSQPDPGAGSGLTESEANGLYFKQNSNLSEGDPATIRSNIDVYSTTEADNLFLSESEADDLYLEEANNLSDLTSITTAQDNLGLTDGSADLRFNTLQVDGALTLEGNVAFNADGALFSYNTDGTGRGLWDATASGTQMWQVRLDGSNNLNFDRRDAGAGDFLIDGNLSWHAGNDGPGSGLDADLWDGNQFDDYLNQPVRTSDNVSFEDVEVNERLTAADGNFVAHENGRSYYDVVGQSFVFNADSSTRGFLSISRGSVGDTGSTNRIWNVEIKASDDIVFNPDTGGGVDFPSEISNNNQDFSTGFPGNGWKMYQDSSEWYLETDVGFFRSALFANEFTINQILATQGSRIASPGRGKVETIVDDTTGSEIIEFSDPEGNNYPSMAVDDTVFCLQARNDLDVGTTNVLEDDGGVIVKRFVRRVESVDGTEVTLDSFGNAPNDAGTISEGDVFVVIGNINDTSRQNLLYETVIEPHAPYTVLKTGITGWNAYKSADNIMMKYGNLNQSYGYTSDTYGLAVGPPSGDHATFDADNGVRFIDGSGLVGAQFNSSILTLGTGSNFVEFDVSAGTGNIELNQFTLESTRLLITDALGNGGLIQVNPGSSNQVGLRATGGTGSSSDIVFWAGSELADRDTAPVRIALNGDASFADVLTVNASAQTVGLSAFTADTNLLSMSNNGIDIEMGNAPFGSIVRGFAVSDGTSNSRIYLAEVGGEFVFSVRESGNDIAELGSRDNFIAGWDLTASQFQSTNLSGGGDGSFTTDGILINSGGYISAENFWIDSSGAGALGDLDLTGDLSMTTSGLMSDGSSWQISGDHGLDFVAGEGSLNAIQWHDSDFTDNSDLYAEIYSYHDSGANVNRLVLRSISYNASQSDIVLTASDVETNARMRINQELNFNGGNVSGYMSLGGELRLPRRSDSSRANDPNPGEIIFNTDAGNIQFADNSRSWQGV